MRNRVSDSAITIALATSAKVPELTDDDRLLVDALAAAGVRAEPAVWTDSQLDWRKYAGVVIRSTWDYHLKHEEFLSWLDRLSGAGVPVWNTPALVKWNSEKTYLRELADAGVAIVPTRWLECGDVFSLADVFRDTGWDEAVVKPGISASAHDTWRVSAEPSAADESEFARMVGRDRVLVQPFIREVQTEGEWSLLFYGGSYSHSVIKRPASRDFRVQREHGGTSERLEPPAHVIDAAARALAAAEHGRAATLYARVDGCVVDSSFVLMELELIEPDLFLREHAYAPSRLAAALVRAITSNFLTA